MAIKGLFALIVATLLVAATAVMFSLDSLAAARNDDPRATTKAAPAAHDHTNHNVALPLASFAGQVPDNADELAKAHKAYDATLPPAQSGDPAKVHMTLKDMVVEIAPRPREGCRRSRDALLPARPNRRTARARPTRLTRA